MSHWTLDGLEVTDRDIPRGPVDVNFDFAPGLTYRGRACAAWFDESVMLDVLIDHPRMRGNRDEDEDIAMDYVVYRDALELLAGLPHAFYRLPHVGCRIDGRRIVPDGRRWDLVVL